MAHKQKIIIFLFIFLNICSLAFALERGNIRVAIIEDEPGFYLTIRGRFEILALGTNEPLYQSSRLRSSQVLPEYTGIKIGNLDFKICCLRIVAKKDATIYVNDRLLRGEINIIRNKNLKLTVVNNLDLEDYVRGVLYHEVSHLWPIEAIKAQAVATRSFALYQAGLNKNKDFDLTSDIRSQVYGGRFSERNRTNKAVNKTKGEVLYFKQEVLAAFFSATCAGHTEDAGNLWKIDLLPLKGVVCNFCINSAHYQWKRNFRLKNIEEKLRKAGYDLGDIKNISVLKRNSSGRIEVLEIICREGSSFTISGKDFRQIIGPNEIRSNNYEILIKGYYVDFKGIGWGHGVGLCQWGAKGMAEKGFNYRKILSFYYPGATIKK
ncbi:MAG: SpoIID/LytB domain-containing protein [Candidatus Omnitrophota bacterium]|nr:SpoIID/LytB domain-containing protein [Candidatus Omnitrophota bacterium]